MIGQTITLACLSLLLIGLIRVVSCAQINMSVVKTVFQSSTSCNLAYLGGFLYHHGFFTFRKSDPNVGNSFLDAFTQNSGITTDEPTTYILISVPESQLLVYVGFKGTVYVLDVNNPTSPVKSTVKLSYYGVYKGIYAYQAARKPGTNLIYVASLMGRTIQRFDFTNLNSTVRMISGQSIGYEMMAITESNEMVLISSNGGDVEVFDLTTDMYSKTLRVQPAWGEYIVRSVEWYPRIKDTNTYLFPTTGKKAYFVNSNTDTILRVYNIEPTNPEVSIYMPNTNYIMIVYYLTMQFIDMEQGDAGIKTQYLGTASYYISVAFLPFAGKQIMAISPIGSFSTTLIDTGNEFCHFSCQNCTKSMDNTACSTCAPGYVMGAGTCDPQTSGTGVLLSDLSPAAFCPSNEYRNVDRLCKPCPTDCSLCYNYTGFCYSCTGGKKVGISGTCDTACNANEFELIVGGQSFCKRCHPSCTQCTGPDEDQCTVCDAAKLFSLVPPTQGRCISNCNPSASNPFYSALRDQCIDCGRNCSVCGLSGLYYSCFKCKNGMWVQSGECVQTCPMGMISNSSNGRCEYCEEKGLDMIFFNGTCIKNTECPSDYTFTDLQCYKEGQAPPNNNPSFPGLPTNNSNENTTNPNTNKDTDSKEKGNDSSGKLGDIFVFIGMGICGIMIVTAAYCISKHSRQSSQVQNRNNQQTRDELRRGASLIPIQMVNLPSVFDRQMSPDGNQRGDEGDWVLNSSERENPTQKKREKIMKMENQFAKNQSLSVSKGNLASPEVAMPYPNFGQQAQIPVFMNGEFINVNVKPKKFVVKHNNT